MKNKLFLEIILVLIIFSFSKNLSKESNKLKINKNYSYPEEQSIIGINLDNFAFGNIKDNSNIYYKIQINKDSEQIFFDFQSEYGCLYINIEDENITNFIFCSEGENNIFSLNKSDILEKIAQNKNGSISGLNLIIRVGYSNLEFDSKISFDFALKISLRKPIINIFEINSEHKILCKTEKINETNYRCLFILINNKINNNLIVYSTSNNNIKLNIFANYINTSIYKNWNSEYLTNNIPNINSTFNNYNTEKDFINIKDLDPDKYIYISVESNNETTIEIITQMIPDSDEIYFSQENEMQLYNINKNLTNINLYFNYSFENEILLSLVTLYGKASIYLGYDETVEYITDIRENKIFFQINLESCYKVNNTCKLIINNLEQNEDKELGYIFYISYKNIYRNVINELEYGKSNKLLYTNFEFPIILYEKLTNISSNININLQLYNIQNINLDINALILSKKELYHFKVNNNYINNFNNSIKGKFDTLLGANIYLTIEEMKSFNIKENPFLLIYIPNKNNNIDKLIISSTISQINSLIYPSERIYHYGKLNNEEKIVYRMEGKSKYHLMRLEFGRNSDLIGWSVKRTNNNDNYRNNDTDLSFVTEKWSNGRVLLTMYIENGEDIYLTIFPKDKIENNNLTNYIFKYINSAKNGDFKNYIIKYDTLNYDKNNNQIIINKLNNIPYTFEVNYYLKIITENDYIKNEEINTIALTASNISLITKGYINDGKIFFDLKNLTKNESTYYYINAFGIIIEKFSDIELISYSSKFIKLFEIENTNDKDLVLFNSTISIGLFSLLILLVKWIKYRKRKRRAYNYFHPTYIRDFIVDDDDYNDDIDLI